MLRGFDFLRLIVLIDWIVLDVFYHFFIFLVLGLLFRMFLLIPTFILGVSALYLSVWLCGSFWYF